MTVQEWCAEQGIDVKHYMSVSLVLDRLTDDELAAQINAAAAGWDPRPVLGWDKIQSLYVQNKKKQKPYLRDDDREIMLMVAGPRIDAALGAEAA